MHVYAVEAPEWPVSQIMSVISIYKTLFLISTISKLHEEYFDPPVHQECGVLKNPTLNKACSVWLFFISTVQLRHELKKCIVVLHTLK